MNILFLNSIGRQKWGGGEKWMLTAATGMRDLGHGVIIGCRSNSILEKKSVETDLKVVNISINWDFAFLKILTLRKYCEEFQIDVIIGCLNKDVKIAGLMAQIYHKPLIISRQGVPQITNCWKHKIVFKNICHGIITNTQSIKTLYDSYGWWDNDFVKVIYNGMDISSNIAEPYIYQLPENIEKTKARIVLSAGRLAAQKGFEILIDAAKIACEQDNNILFYIAGEGRSRELLQQRIEKNNLKGRVFLLGFIENVKSLFPNADLFVLSSHYEGMPNAVMEAMAYGVPVISTRVNGVEELIGNNNCGTIIESGKPQLLADEIASFFKTSDHNEQIENAKQRIASTFTVNKMSRNIESFLQKKIEARMKKKILIIQTAFIGDVILVTPLIESIYDQHPEWQIDILVRKGNESILANNPKLGKVLIFDKRGGKYKNMLNLIKEIRRTKYDEVINIQRYFTTGLITALSGAKFKVGFNKNPLSFCYNLSVAHKFDSDAKLHEVERNLKTVEHLTSSKIIRPRLYPSEADFEFVKQAKRYVTMAPSSVWFTKALPTHKWIELINLLSPDKDIILLGAPADSDLCENLLKLSGKANVFNHAGKYSLLQSAALMKGAEMNFVNDSGPLHLASSVDAPVRAFFCSTVKEFGYTPLSTDSKVIEIQDVLACRPCGLHGKKNCPQGHFKCGEIDVKLALK